MVDWYASSNLGTHASLGSKGPRPGSLAGLYEARKANLAQYFTPKTVSDLTFFSLLSDYVLYFIINTLNKK